MGDEGRGMAAGRWAIAVYKRVGARSGLGAGVLRTLERFLVLVLRGRSDVVVQYSTIIIFMMREHTGVGLHYYTVHMNVATCFYLVYTNRVSMYTRSVAPTAIVHVCSIIRYNKFVKVATSSS